VADGETIEVTNHGHPIARIVPVRAGALEQMVSEGRATPAHGDLLDLAEAIGLPDAGAKPASAALAELRADER
jgi:antitoxin (DNA-binding transcriptional repressor) of toxin-antitoxin stability system